MPKTLKGVSGQNRFKIAFYEEFLSGYWPRGLFLFQTYRSFLIIERLVFFTSSIPPLYLMFNFFYQNNVILLS